MNIKELADKYNDYIIEKRRFFHTCPELSEQEAETTKAIVEELNSLGLEVQTFKEMYGCVGILRGGKPGPTVLLRCDIDGLPVYEKTGLPFKSKIEGRMHACGHDTHIAMQFGAIRILQELKEELAGNIKFLFQPAEELALGAKYAVAQGVFDDVSACFGMHIWGQVDAGKMSIEQGERMASCDMFTLTIRGKASHGSAPHLGNDAIVAASAVIMNLQSIVSRSNDPLNGLVLTIGTFDGGQRFNIIADKVVMDGTVRTFDRKFRMKMESKILEIAQQTAKCYGCTAEIDYTYMVSPVINDNEDMVRIAKNAAISLYGKEMLVKFEKITGSEDFGVFMEKVPSVFTFLGARNEKVPGSELSNHHEKYTVDEEVLHRGAAVASQFAYDFLKEQEVK